METHRTTHNTPLARRIRWGNVALALIVMTALAGLLAQFTTRRQSTPRAAPRVVLTEPATSPTGPAPPVRHKRRASDRLPRSKRHSRRHARRRSERKARSHRRQAPQAAPRYMPEPRSTTAAPPGTGDLEP